MTPLEDRINELPPDLRREVEDFIEFLIAKHARRGGKPLELDWAGALDDLKSLHTSVELQHQIALWRSGGE